MKNPFQYGKVAEKENFIDRETDREFLKGTLYSGTNVILMSPRRWGKSSVVKQAMGELAGAHPEVRVVSIDAFPITSSKEFYEVFAREVLRATSSHFESVMESVGRFLKNLSPRITFSPEPMTEFALSIDLGDTADAVDCQAVLSLPERIAREKGLQVIVCIDEFQKLAKLADYGKLESLMRSVWQHQQSVSYCLYGSQRHMMDEIFNAPEKPFYRFGQMYHLKKIAEAEWVEYIEGRFEATGKRISRELAQEVARIAECHSWYVQQLASAVWNFTAEEATRESVDKALQWCVDVNSDTYQQLCDRLAESQLRLLKAVAAGESQLTSAETVRRYGLGTSGAVVKNRKVLVNGDVIVASRGEQARFLDPIFAEWFRRCYR